MFDIPRDSTLDTDVARFVHELGWTEDFNDGTLAGPFAVPAPHHVRLYVAKLTSNFA